MAPTTGQVIEEDDDDALRETLASGGLLLLLLECYLGKGFAKLIVFRDFFLVLVLIDASEDGKQTETGHKVKRKLKETKQKRAWARL